MHGSARGQRRRRVFHRLRILRFVLRLVAAPRGPGYGTPLSELWEPCEAAGLELPQAEPPAASTAGAAREKLDEAAFQRLHAEVLAHGPEGTLGKGHRTLAVDGSKITLPRELAQYGDRVIDGAHYPQGRVSTLYRIGDRIPVDFDRFDHENERAAALVHLGPAAEGDVIVYDRGSTSFALALAHRERKLNFGFRIRNGAHSGFDAVLASGESDRTVPLDAPGDETALRSRTLRVRLVRYRHADTESGLATSLLDGSRDPVPAISDLDPARGGVEERYKTGTFRIEAFPAPSERGVRPELYAAFVRITLARPFANRCDHDLDDGDDRPALRTNFRNGLRLVGKEIEALFLAQSVRVARSVKRILSGLSRCIPRERPGRSYVRQSKQPKNKWQHRVPA